MAQQQAAVNTFVTRVSVREVVSDVAQGGGTQQGIAQGVDGNVGIAVSQQSALPRNIDTTQPQGPALDQAVNVKSHSHAHHHSVFFI